LKSNEIQIHNEEVTSSQDTVTDRYYRSLFEVLLKVHLNKPTKMDEFFSLLFKSIKSDKNNKRVLAFVRRII